MALEEMGFRVEDIWDFTIYDEYALEDWLRRKFGLAGTRGGGGPMAGVRDTAPSQHYLDEIWKGVQAAEKKMDDLQMEIPNLIKGL